MKIKKKIQYVYFTYGKRKIGFREKSRKFEVSEIGFEKDENRLDGIDIVVNGVTGSGLSHKDVKNLEKRLKDYDLSEAVVMADEKMADILDISDMLFAAKKYELIHNCFFIMKKIKQKFDKSDNAAIVIGSARWELKDIFSILDELKDNYKKIDIVMQYQLPNITSLVELAYDEWGVVLHAYSVRNYNGSKKDFVIFLVDKWKDFWIKKVPFGAAYVVTDDTESTKQVNNNNVFSGLIYKGDKEMPMDIGTHMAWQKPMLCEKFHVSVIDIY